MLEILDVVIATAAVILGLSLVVQAIQQIVKQTLDLKSSYMRAELLALFGDPRKSSPLDNISPVSVMANAASDSAKRLVTEIERKLRSFGFSDLHLLEDVSTARMQEIMRALPLATEEEFRQEFQKAVHEVDRWFDITKQAFQEHYERRMKLWAFVISLLVVVATNANIIGIYRDFSSNKVLRDAAVSWGEHLAASPSSEPRRDTSAVSGSADSAVALQDIRANVALMKEIVNNNSYQLLRWDKASAEKGELVIGWLAMTLLVSLGAPFWHDMLKSVMGLKDQLTAGAGRRRAVAGDPKTAEGRDAETGEIPAVG